MGTTPTGYLAEDFAQDWNFLCHFQAPSNANARFDNLDRVDSDLDDIEDFVEADTNHDRDCNPLGEEQGLSIQRKQVRLCRHKLQTRAFPKLTKKKAWRSPEHNLEPENQDLDPEWLQLIQMEKEIQKRRNQLREAEAGD